MRKALELLAKHNLSMADVEAHEGEAEGIGRSDTNAGRTVWQRYVWAGISRLYFCNYFREVRYVSGKPKYTHVVIGRESNVETVEDIVTYLVDLGEELARNTGGDTVYRNAFKLGYGRRIRERAIQQKDEATTRFVDSDTGGNLPILQLYELTTRENEEFMAMLGIRLTFRNSRPTYSSNDGYQAGQVAGQSVSLSSAARGRIGNK